MDGDLKQIKDMLFLTGVQLNILIGIALSVY